MVRLIPIPKIKFNNGYEIPVIGLGTWQATSSQMATTINDAIDLGYRHIDCAYFYRNEKAIGTALAGKLAEKSIGRADLFITSKLWNTHHRPDHVEPAIMKSLEALRLRYLDLYLMHWPMAYRTGHDLLPKDKTTGKIAYSKVDYVETWKAMEELVKKGLTKSIGVANFNKRQILRILENCSIVPVNNQVECHPYFNQCKMMEFCRSKGITLTCYSPLGSPARPWANAMPWAAVEPVLLQDKIVKELGEKYSRSSAQILLRYQIERHNIVIPKSVSKNRLHENICIFDFKLDTEDMDALDCLHTGKRFIALQEDNNHPDHPFARDEY